MALLNWNDLSWNAFVAGLLAFRDAYAGNDRQDLAYFRSLGVIQEVPLQARPERSQNLVLILNQWACRLSSALAPDALADWMRTRLDRLAALEPLTILDPEVAEQADELGDLHDELIAHMRAQGVRNMSDAAASKTLHLLLPALFVMWDKEIRRSAPEGYAAYMRRMHGLAVRLSAEATVPPARIESHLQERLGYPDRKTLAKYLDEYNWYEAVGRPRAAAG